MSAIPFSAEQRRFFHAQCSAMSDYCAATGLRPLVIMAHREIFDVFCIGNRSGALQAAPVNDNRPPSYPP